MSDILRQPLPCACGDHAFLSLTRGQVALVSLEDAEVVADRLWYASKRPNGRFYAVTRAPRGCKLYMHRAIMGKMDAPETEHRNHDGLDNRRRNLAPVSRQGNQANRRKNKPGLHRYKGVRQVGARFYARVRVNYRYINAPGGFATAEEAARAYDRLALAHFGPSAATNAALGLLA